MSLYNPFRHLWHAAPLRTPPAGPAPPLTSQFERTILSQSNPASPQPLQPISASLSPPAVSALLGLAAAASAPRRDRTLPPRPAPPRTRPHGPEPPGLGAVTVPEPPDAVSAILEPYVAVRMRQVRRGGSAGHCGSCSAEEGQHLEPPTPIPPPRTSGSRGGGAS